MPEEKKPLLKKTPSGSSARLTYMQEQIDEVRSLVEENLRYSKNLHDTSSQASVQGQEELKKLLQQNLKISKELLGTTKKINKYLLMQRVWGFLKILIIIVPIALGILYLPPIIKNLVEPYQDLLRIGSPQTNTGQILEQLSEGLSNEQPVE